MYARLVKRGLDLALVILTGPLWVPLVAILAALVRLTLGKPIFFRQQRPGRNAKPFAILKLRTMTCGSDSSGRVLPDEKRLTRLGRLLRSSSLDEMPELFNVLRGDMSLVGPRPLLTEYLSRYTSEQARRHEVPPGITGWAQVNGRNALTWEDKFRLDVWYVDHLSFALDLRILVLTGWKVLRGEGISAEGYATMPEFLGTQTSERP
jgi:sugar transferase EpsL